MIVFSSYILIVFLIYIIGIHFIDRKDQTQVAAVAVMSLLFPVMIPIFLFIEIFYLINKYIK